MLLIGKNLLIVGDVHGKYHQLKPILESTEDDVLCVGDVGVGFPSIGARPLFRKNFQFIRGNHDKPEDCRNHPQYLGDFGVYQGIFFLGGAKSVDAHHRREGIDWWRDEHLSEPELRAAVEQYAAVKPEIVISHDCPWEIAWDICRAVQTAIPWTREFGDPRPYATTLAMDEMLKIHRPKLWCYGHWHLSHRIEKDGTRFICLDELETLDLQKELDSLK